MDMPRSSTALAILVLAMTFSSISGQFFPSYTSSYYRAPYSSHYGGSYLGGGSYPYYTQNRYTSGNYYPGQYQNNYNSWTPSFAYNTGFGGGYNGFSSFQQRYPYNNGYTSYYKK